MCRAEHVDVVEVARQKAAIPPAMRRTSSLWNRFLLDDELIKMGGLISKRKGLFSKKRQLILTSKPRLIYIDPIRMKQKGEIPWSESLYVNSKSATAFDVVTVRSSSCQVHGARRRPTADVCFAYADRLSLAKPGVPSE